MTKLIARPKLMKQCNLCHESKPLDQFDRDKSIASGYRGRCKPCRSAVETERKRAKRAGKNTKVAGIEAARKRHVSMEEQERLKYSEANRNAIGRLIRIHESEFRMIVEEERRRLGVKPKWVAATG